MTSRVDQRLEVAEFIAEVFSGWSVPNEAVDFQEVRWLPDLIHADGRMLYLAFEDIDPPWARRLKAAGKDGNVVVACAPQAVTVSNLELTQQIDAQLILLDGNADEIEATEYGSVAAFVTKYELFLETDGLKRLAGPLFDRALACEDTFRKGLLFEQVLCLLFSQVSYLQVLEHRYTNETEEIDLVLGNRATGPLSEILGGPLVLVSGKNQAKPVGAPEIRALRGSMQNRRGRCSFGILAAANDLARTTKAEQMHATTDASLAVALLDGSRIRDLISSDTLDHDLQGYLMAAVLD